MKLVLEGGGSRAAYGAGFVDALAEAKLPIRAVVGCSSGSINAAFLASGQTKTVCRLWGDFVPGRHFISWRRQFTPGTGPGLAVDDMLDRVITGGQLLDTERATSGRPALYVAVTHLGSGEGRLVRPEASNLIEWLRASLAIPVGYNRVVSVEGEDYVDGGVALPVPFDHPLEPPVAEVGPTVVVLTRGMGTAKTAPSLWQRAFIRAFVPAAAREATLRQHKLHDALMARLRSASDGGEVLVVDPPADLPVSRLTRDAGRIRASIELGREVGRAFCANWQAGEAGLGLQPEVAACDCAATQPAESASVSGPASRTRRADEADPGHAESTRAEPTRLVRSS